MSDEQLDAKQELNDTILAIEQLHDECDALQHAYRRLPWWAAIRQHRNLNERARVLAATKPYWVKLYSLSGADLQGKISSVTEVFR